MGKAINLGIFATANIQRATLGLLSDLGIDMEVRSQQQIPIPAVVAASLGQTPKAVQDICNKIAESYLAGIISDQTFTDEQGAVSFEEACANAGRYEQMMVFAVDFKKSEKVTRSEMATLTRALNRASKACPVVLVCRYADEEGTRFALSLCERTAYKQAGHTGEKAGKVNILRGIYPENPHTGHVRILEDMRLERKDNTFEAVYNKWFGVFDNDVLTSQFYKELQDWFFWAVKHVQFPNDIDDDTDDQKYNPQNVIRLITRLIFVWFLRQKGLVPKELFNREDLDHLVKDFEPDNFESSTYYRVILQNLFFATLNKKIEDRAFISDNFIENRNLGKHKIKTFMRHASDLAVSKEEFIRLLRPVPFMNNSLFECLDNKEQNGRIYNWDGFSDSNKPQRQAFIPNYLFFAKEEYVDLSKEYDRASASSTKVFGLLNILKRYNFTVEENTPLDQDVALDPELLGKVFENLLAAYNPETEQTVRKSTGSYYTPRPIVQYMVDESLVAYLKKAVPNVEETTLRSLLSYSDDDQASTLNEKHTRDIVEAIFNCKVLDPACGSGAFPMGMLQQMSHLLSRVDATNKYWEDVVINRAVNDEAFINKLNDEEKEAHRNEIEEVFKLSVNYPDYARKLYLIENCIYGVDLQSIAVQISRLRFFISLLCEQQPSDDASKNYNIKPLPNLEMKFVSANSLVRLEHIDEARELFANQDILDLIAQLKGVRHELFVVTDHHVKERLLAKDETLRSQIMLSTGDCYVKDVEEKIRKYELTIADKGKELKVAERMPDEVVRQVEYNLFGEEESVTIINKKEQKIREIKGRIAYFKKEISSCQKSMSSGRDKAMRLAKQLTDWNPYDQNVSSPFFDPEWMFGITNGFDVVIGNPPYVSVRTKAFDSTLKPYYKDHYSLAVGQYDLYVLFIEKAKSLLNESGSLCYIVPTRLLSNENFQVTRDYLESDLPVNVFVNAESPFESANVEANIMLCEMGSQVPYVLSYGFDKKTQSFYFSTKVDRERITEMPFHIYPFVYDDQTLSVFSKLQKVDTIELGSCLNITRGFECGYNDSCITQYESTYPLIKAEAIKPYVLEIDRLLYCNPDFSNSTKYKTKEVFFNVPKLVTKFCSGTINFAIDTIGYCNTNSVYNCEVVDKSLMYYLLAVLNAKISTFWFNVGFMNIDGLFPHIQKNQLEAIPIPQISSVKQTKLTELVNEIVAIKTNNPTDDVSKLEDNIDMIVYSLYNLSFEDILVIDPNTHLVKKEYDTVKNEFNNL